MDIVILAGGLGSRFFVNSSKVLVSFWGESVLKMLCANAIKASKNVYVVLREDMELQDAVVKIKQKNVYGTGAAVQSYIEYVEKEKDVLIIPGDAPLVDYEVIKKFQNNAFEADIVLGIMKMPDGKEHYGRVFIENGCVKKIIEYKHHNEKTEYANTGIMFVSKKILPLIKKLEVGEGGEVYLTEIIEIAITNGYKVKALILDHEEALGFNTVTEFNHVLSVAQDKWRKKALKSNAIFFDINTVYLSYDTSFELGSIIEPYVRFLPGVKVGAKAVIKAFSSLQNCYVNGTIGPFANIKSGEIHERAEIGSFVEVNRSIIEEGSKAKHLSYLGDVELGKNVNIGAGCVICNYDGKNKNKSIIGEGSFIGGNTTLIAPINIGEKALLAAGSTFTKDVGDMTLAIARSYQINKPKKN